MRNIAPAAVVASAWLAGCVLHPKKSSPAPPRVPPRAATAGDALFRYVSAGAQLVAEVDLARLRTNPVVGALAQRLLGTPRDVAQSAWWSQTVWARADSVVLASFGLGSPNPTTLIVGRGHGLAELAGATRLGPGVFAFGPGPALAKAAPPAARRASLDSEAQLLALRAQVMPRAATGASLRLAARLDFEARLDLSRRFDLEQVPVSISLWGDVIDDLAIVAHLGASTVEEAAELVPAARRWCDALARDPAIRRAGLEQVVRRIEIGVHGKTVRAVLVLGPTRLRWLVKSTLRKLGQPL